MSDFRDLTGEIMDLALQFSPTTNTAMKRRKAALKELAVHAASWVREAFPEVSQELDLRAEDGGQVGGVSPVAWMRVFSRAKSPSATAGFYLVYLFDAVGGSVYLSLNQGTSEYRAGQWRPILNRQKIIDNASRARFALEEAGADISWGGPERLTLGVQGLRDAGVFTSRDPVDRARNYELGTVLAIAYGRRALPSDDVFRSDLINAVSSLVELYGVSIASPDLPSAPKATSLRRGIGRLSSTERRAVELRSMEITRAYYETDGWVVEDVSGYRPYDFECSRNGIVLHVEVKGTTADDFRQIELTRNEVDHCRSFPAMELALVSQIRLGQDDSGNWIGSGGELYFVVPWAIDEQRLAPLSYLYQLPDKS